MPWLPGPGPRRPCRSGLCVCVENVRDGRPAIPQSMGWRNTLGHPLILCQGLGSEARWVADDLLT